jgi:hypothetical protein
MRPKSPWDNPHARHLADVFRSVARTSPRIDIQGLMTLGHTLWAESYAHTSDDWEAFERLKKYLETLTLERIPGMRASEALHDPGQQLQMVGSALWCAQGFPRLVMGHKYAASLLVTRVHPTIADLIEAPWRSFVIDVPSGLIALHDEHQNQAVDVTHLLVFREVDSRWNIVAFTTSSTLFYRYGMSTARLCDEEAPPEECDPFSTTIRSLDERAMLLVRNEGHPGEVAIRLGATHP